MSLDRDPDALLARIDRLERRAALVTRLLAATVALVVVGLAALLAGDRWVASAQGRAAVPEEVVARRFKVVDAAGKPRVMLYVDENQAAGVALSDPAGQTRVLLNTDGQSSKLAIVGPGESSAKIVLAQDGDMQLFTMDDQRSGFALTQASTAKMFLVSQRNSIDLEIAHEVVQGKATMVPRITLEQGDRTLATLPAAAAPPR